MKNASIDVKAAIELGITLVERKACRLPPLNSPWGLLLALARSIPAEVESVAPVDRKTRVGVGLAGKTLGIVGLGTIGAHMARFAQAFDISVLVWSPRIKDEACIAAGAHRASSLDDLMEPSDFVTVQMVLSDSTRCLIGYLRFAMQDNRDRNS